MMHYIVRRLLQAAVTLIVVSMLIFLLLHLWRGDPGWIILGRRATPAKVHRLDAMLGVLLPWPVQYVRWLQLLFAGELSSVFSAALPTLFLLVSGGGLGLVLAMGVAILQARFPRSWVDHVTSVVSLTFYALPSFWVGFVLFLLFGIDLGWVPLVPPGYYPGAQSLTGWSLAMSIPVITIALTTISGWSMHLRAALEESLLSDYVRTARAKGLPEALIVRRHVVRSGFLPLLSMIGMSFPVLFSNLIAIEWMFQIAGVGFVLQVALATRAYGTVLDVVFVIGLITMMVNLLVDILSALADPRIRFE